MASPLPRVAVAIITGGTRPGPLRDLLLSLGQQEGRGTEFELGVVVVDNASIAMADDFSSILEGIEVRTVRESTPGIPFARNKSVQEAQEWGADVIAFVDDDERASSAWISNALRAMNEHQADAVAGSVTYRFARDIPAWQRLGGFYDEPNYTSGDNLPFARTTNLFVKSLTISQVGHPVFDEKLQFTGGSDVDFTTRLVATGARLVWSTEAGTEEDVPIERCEASWVLRRSLRVGNNIGRRAAKQRGLRGVLTCLAMGLPRVGVGSVKTLLGFCTGRATWAGQGIRTAIRGVGMLSAPMLSYEEYKR